MLLLIKSVNLTLSEKAGNIVISETKHDVRADVNNLCIFFSQIQEEYKIMEEQFNEKFDTLIFDYRETLNRFYFQEIEQEEGKKEEIKKYNPIALYTVLELPFLREILPKIVFQYFLMFYDEYSYAINERIANFHISTFIPVVLESENLSNSKELVQSKSANNEDYEKFKYLDLHYFRNKLETKLSEIFKISIIEIRSILYGYHFEDEEMETAYIQLFYDIVLYYRQHGFTSSANGFYLWTGEIPESLIDYENIIFEAVRKHADLFSCSLPLLYLYHQEASQKFNVSVTRFDMYEKLLEKYGSIENAPNTIRREDRELFKKHVSRQHLRMFKNIFLYHGSMVTALRRQVFIYVNYDTKENLFNILFNKIKDILVSINT